MNEAQALEAPGFSFEDPVQTSSLDADQLWFERFMDMDRYDWNDPGFKRRNRGEHAFLPIPLTQGFFMIVPKWFYQKMIRFPDGAPKKWCVKIDREKETRRIIKVYGRRNGRAEYGEPATVYAAREITDKIHGKKKVDHVNGWSLDNRWSLSETVNLDYVSSRENISNAVSFRRVNTDLKRGVEKRTLNAKGEQRYGGTMRIRHSKTYVECVRSKRLWLTQEPAHQWYLNRLKERHQREAWAFSPSSVTFPIFPPLLESQRATRRKNKQPVDAHLEELLATF